MHWLKDAEAHVNTILNRQVREGRMVLWQTSLQAQQTVLFATFDLWWGC